MPNWNRVNVWTHTLYALIQALSTAKQIHFGNLPKINENIRDAANWVPQNCSYNSVLLANPFGNRTVRFRIDPNTHFEEIATQTIKMLIQDLVVILDEMMADILISLQMRPTNYPQSKINQLLPRLSPNYTWSSQGCLELVAVRNVLTHSGGIWNARSIQIVRPFINPAPVIGDRLIVGVPMLFRYRKAMRTFLNEVM